MNRKQEVVFYCVSKSGLPFMTNDLSRGVIDSMTEPKPVNRKSRRAIIKMIKETIANDSKPIDIKARRIQKEKKKRLAKIASVSRRFNRAS